MALVAVIKGKRMSTMIEMIISTVVMNRGQSFLTW